MPVVVKSVINYCICLLCFSRGRQSICSEVMFEVSFKLIETILILKVFDHFNYLNFLFNLELYLSKGRQKFLIIRILLTTVVDTVIKQHVLMNLQDLASLASMMCSEHAIL